MYGWGSGVFFYLIYQAYGATGVSIAVSLVAVWTFFLLYRLLLSYRIPRIVNLTVIASVIPIAATRWPNRPELFTYPFLILLFLCFHHAYRYKKFLLFIPLIILLWTNMYGASTFVGLLAVFGFIIWSWIQKKQAHARLSLLVLGITSIIASLLAPSTYKGLFYSILYIPKIAWFQGEWSGILEPFSKAPLEFILSYQYRVLLYILFSALVLLSIGIHWKKDISHPMHLLPLIVLLIPIFGFRLTVLSCILVTPVFANAIADSTGKMRRLIIFCCLGTTLISAGISLYVTPIGIPKPDLLKNDELTAFITTNHLTGNVLNTQELGAYLSYYYYPNLLVSYDTRDDLFLKSTILQDMRKSKNIRMVLSKYKISMVIYDFTSMGNWYEQIITDPEWSLVFFNRQIMLFVPKTVAAAKKLPTYDAVNPFSATGAKPNREEQAINEYTHAGIYAYVAELLIERGKYDEALSVLPKIDRETGPTAPIYEIQRASLEIRAYIGKKDCVRAKTLITATETEATGKLLFTPWKKLPIPVMETYTNECGRL